MAIDIELLVRAMKFVRDPQDEEVERMALVMLKMNRKQVLYRNILVRPKYLKATLIYELKKCIDERLPRLNDEQKQKVEEALGDGVPADDDDDADSKQVPAENADETANSFQSGADLKASEDDAELVKSVGETVKKQPGLREDHEQLPDNVKEWFEGSKKRWFEMKEIHASLQTMDAASPEERAPYTKKLRQLFGEYRKCLNDYDHFNPKDVKPEPVENVAQKVATARKYLSDNREKLAAAIAVKDEDKVAKLRCKMQDRIHTILEQNLGFDPQIKEALTKLGLNFD